MSIVSLGENLHEMPKLIFWEKEKTIINLASAEFAQRVAKVKEIQNMHGLVKTCTLQSMKHVTKVCSYPHILRLVKILNVYGEEKYFNKICYLLFLHQNIFTYLLNERDGQV